MITHRKNALGDITWYINGLRWYMESYTGHHYLWDQEGTLTEYFCETLTVDDENILDNDCILSVLIFSQKVMKVDLDKICDCDKLHSLDKVL